MPLRVQILGSSSGGNCALVETGESRFLIDAGFSGRKIEGMLAARGLSARDLDAVLVTHEHTDHAAGIRGLAKFEQLEFFATPDTASAIQRGLKRAVPWRTFQSGQRFRLRDCVVEALKLPHDAYDPVGFVVTTGRPDDLFDPLRQVAWVTDLGHIPAGLGERLKSVDLLVLEANHDDDLLDDDPHRPFSVKQRIRGTHGHLSNATAAQFLRETDLPRIKHVCLGHLSTDCNDPAEVRKTFGAHCGGAPIHIVPPGETPSAVFELSGF